MEETMGYCLKTKEMISIIEPEFRFEYAYKKQNMYSRKFFLRTFQEELFKKTNNWEDHGHTQNWPVTRATTFLRNPL